MIKYATALSLGTAETEAILRREIHEGLHVVENWNAAHGFIHYGKGGEFASNRLDDQEISMLALHYYPYLKSVFRALRAELEVEIPKAEHRLPGVPTEEELRQFYQVVWQTRNFADMVLIKALFYTGVRVSSATPFKQAFSMSRLNHPHVEQNCNV